MQSLPALRLLHDLLPVLAQLRQRLAPDFIETVSEEPYVHAAGRTEDVKNLFEEVALRHAQRRRRPRLVAIGSPDERKM